MILYILVLGLEISAKSTYFSHLLLQKSLLLITVYAKYTDDVSTVPFMHV